MNSIQFNIQILQKHEFVKKSSLSKYLGFSQQQKSDENFEFIATISSFGVGSRPSKKNALHKLADKAKTNKKNFNSNVINVIYVISILLGVKSANKPKLELQKTDSYNMYLYIFSRSQDLQKSQFLLYKKICLYSGFQFSSHV